MAGTLGTETQVRFRSTNLDDLLPALALAEKSPPAEIPLKLTNGSASADGTILGTLEHPRFQGDAEVTNGSIQGHGFDKFMATLDVSESTITASAFMAPGGATEANVSGTIAAGNGSFDEATPDRSGESSQCAAE